VISSEELPMIFIFI